MQDTYNRALAEPGERPRILVVDDTPSNIQTLYQIFCEDHQVLMARNAETALRVCALQRPDLILLDVVMPGVDGYALCRSLKADEKLRDIPVIFVTARNDEAAETRGLDAGAVDFISKPINPRIVRARVKTHLALKSKSDLLRHRAYVDGLTGVHNRRHFDERLEQEWSRSQRQGSVISVLLIDVDHFKRYNDHYGHLAGDECLRRIAAALQAGIRRPTDMVARYGGEEFACILPDTELAGALQVARQIRLNILALKMPHADSPTADVVTISQGVCSAHPKSGISREQLMEAVDAQLYKAKDEGRNRVCGAGSDTS